MIIIRVHCQMFTIDPEPVWAQPLNDHHSIRSVPFEFSDFVSLISSFYALFSVILCYRTAWIILVFTYIWLVSGWAWTRRTNRTKMCEAKEHLHAVIIIILKTNQFDWIGRQMKALGATMWCIEHARCVFSCRFTLNAGISYFIWAFMTNRFVNGVKLKKIPRFFFS